MAKDKKVYWPSWRYGPKGQARIYQENEIIPDGWEDHPSKVVEEPEVVFVDPKLKPKPPAPKKRPARKLTGKKGNEVADAARTEALNALREAGVEIKDDASDKDIQTALDALE